MADVLSRFRLGVDAYITRWLAVVALAAAIGAGAAMRLIWVEDMNFGIDPQWTFAQTQEARRTGQLPRMGVHSSLGPQNSPLSVWVFIFPAWLFDIRDPTGLARIVQLSSIAAIGLLLWFVLRDVHAPEREPWLWGAALASANPLEVIFDRIVWPPSLLPTVSVLMLMIWWRRSQPWAAFVWGMVAALAGQVHASAFFMAAGFFLWAVLFDRGRLAWRFSLAGACLGAVPMLPWLGQLLTADVPFYEDHVAWYRPLEMKFWSFWITQPLGLGLSYALGPHYGDFLGYPVIGGSRTRLVAMLHGVVGGAGVLIGFRALQQHWRVRHRWRTLFGGQDSSTVFVLGAAFCGYGILISLACIPIHRHYLIVTFPLLYVSLAWLALSGPSRAVRSLRVDRALLVVLCAAQFLLTAHFLGYIHVNDGAPLGWYGATYHALTAPGGHPASKP